MDPCTVSADAIVEELGLEPHPEGGAFREMFRDASNQDRACSTAIYYLLRAGEVSAWHCVDAAEVWHWYGGAVIELSQRTTTSVPTVELLGSDVLNGQRPQIVVPRGMWQSARSLGPWTLVGCTVAPGFEFAGFKLASDGQF